MADDLQRALLEEMLRGITASNPKEMVLHCARLQCLQTIVISLLVRPEYRSIAEAARESACTALTFLEGAS